jgi:hypothetical protein
MQKKFISISVEIWNYQILHDTAEIISFSDYSYF